MDSTQFGYNSPDGPGSCLASRGGCPSQEPLISLAQVGSISPISATSRAGLARCARALASRLTNGCSMATGGLAYSSVTRHVQALAGTSPRAGWTVGGGVRIMLLASSGRSALNTFMPILANRTSRSELPTGSSSHDDPIVRSLPRRNYRVRHGTSSAGREARPASVRFGQNRYKGIQGRATTACQEAYFNTTAHGPARPR